MHDLPLLALALTVDLYWFCVGAMMVRIRRRAKKLVGLVPEQQVERFMWIVWVPLVALWMTMPWWGLSRTEGVFALPAFARDLPWYAALRWFGALAAIACLAGSIRCWLRMGDDWRMDVGERKTALITDGLFARVRHPIYALSIALMLCSAIVLPTVPMLVIAAIHLTLMNLKARNEEAHLTKVHGDAYVRYMQRTGRFVPRRAARTS